MKRLLTFFLLTILIVMPFSSAAILPHKTAFAIEEDNNNRVFRYYPYALSLVGESFWNNLCDICKNKMDGTCACLEEGNGGMLPLAQRSIILNGKQKVGDTALNALRTSVDSGLQPLGVANIIEKIYNPLVEKDIFGYLGYGELLEVQNSGEILKGELEFNERYAGLREFDVKFLIYPDSTTKNPYIKNAIINFEEGKIFLKKDGSYIEKAAPVQCSYNWIIPMSVTSDNLNIENKNEENIEIPFKKSILDSCSKTMFENIDWKTNLGGKILSLFGGYFSGSENTICIKSDSVFSAYYSQCSQGVKSGEISPDKESTFVLFFNRGKEDKLNNALCASNRFGFTTSGTNMTQTCFNLEKDGASLELGSLDGENLMASVTEYKREGKDYYNLATYFNEDVFSKPNVQEIMDNNPRINIINSTTSNALNQIRTA